MNNRNRRLRPLGITDILDETVDLYKTNFALLIGISAVLYVPYILLSSLLPQPKDEAMFNPYNWLGIAILGVLFYVVINPLVTGALTFAISERYLDRQTTISDCYRRVSRPGVLLRFIGATVITGLAILGACLLPILMIGASAALMAWLKTGMAIGIGAILIIAGFAAFILPIWLGLRFTLVSPAFFIESEHAMLAIDRSWRLMKGNALKALGLLAIAGIVVAVIQGIVVGPVSLLAAFSSRGGADPNWWMTAISAILNTVVSTLLLPVSSIVMILLYYDVRIRKEGFDLELLANELDQKTRELSAHDITSLPQEQTYPSVEPEKRD
ncbi:glycerophosphoryl diester phosphodiesterase membrane domain-containing protein [bacterium]|nr:glycerophosphoryl diester phosphodiesterase membrane domain-containing protein [bacterium]